MRKNWILGLLLLGACAQMPGSQSLANGINAPTESGEVWVGAIVATQTPAVDRIALGLTAKQYFLPLFRCLKEGKCKSFAGTAILTVRNSDGDIIQGSKGPMEVELKLQGKGFQYVSFPAADLPLIGATSLLCVEIDRPISHQVTRPHWAVADQHVMCTAGLHQWLAVEGRGRSKDDAWGVAAIGTAP